jgi:hypothetical protein
VRAFLNAKTAAAQVTFDPLPGGIELTSMAKTDASGARLGKRAHEAIAWCGFGVPICDPAELVLTLRNNFAILPRMRRGRLMFEPLGGRGVTR